MWSLALSKKSCNNINNSTVQVSRLCYFVWLWIWTCCTRPILHANQFVSVHLDDTKNCPKKVNKCEYCKILFTNAEIVLVKTKGKRQFTCPKTGNEICHVANVYLHYLQTCLKGYDGNFRFESVVVLKQTMSRFPESTNKRSRSKSCK